MFCSTVKDMFLAEGYLFPDWLYQSCKKKILKILSGYLPVVPVDMSDHPERVEMPSTSRNVAEEIM